MKENFTLHCVTESSTRFSNTCLDLTFATNVSDESLYYITYFSYHRPVTLSTIKHHARWGQKVQKKNSVVFSPQAIYTDWVTTTCQRNLVPTFVDRGVSCGQCGGSPTAVNLSFLDRRAKDAFMLKLAAVSIPFCFQFVPLYSANCVKFNTVTCRRVLIAFFSYW
jgi:hypothetical protein